jgi:hypothetical protein
MPPFEIVEDPVPPLLLLSYPPAAGGTCQGTSPPRATRTRYEEVTNAPQGAALPQVIAPPVGAPQVAAPVPATLPQPSPAPEHPVLNLPTPSADPVAMVAELFEKLKASEQRWAAARDQLAEAQQELAGLRTSRPHETTSTSGEMVVLEISFFELDLDGVAKAQMNLPGVTAQELSQSGLFALAARGGLDCCGASAVAQGPASDPCDCVTCQTPLAQGPAAPAAVRSSLAENGRVKALIAELNKAGVAECISRPCAMARSGQTARIQIGQEVPIKTGSVTENGVTQNCIEFCTAGVEFDCKPLVLENGNVQIELRAARSSVIESAMAQDGKPAIARQSIETTLEVATGKTAVVAGLIYERPAAGARQAGPSPYRAAVRYAVPIPEKDRLFRQVAGEAPAAENKRIELVVLVTAKVVSPTATAANPFAPK